MHCTGVCACTRAYIARTAHFVTHYFSTPTNEHTCCRPSMLLACLSWLCRTTFLGLVAIGLGSRHRTSHTDLQPVSGTAVFSVAMTILLLQDQQLAAAAELRQLSTCKLGGVNLHRNRLMQSQAGSAVVKGKVNLLQRVFRSLMPLYSL
jgi:hypothetical protein